MKTFTVEGVPYISRPDYLKLLEEATKVKKVILPADTLPYVFEALDAAGVEYVVEPVEERKIRELEAVIMELEATMSRQCERAEALEAKVLSLTSQLKAARLANDQQGDRINRLENSSLTWERRSKELEEKLVAARGKILNLEATKKGP